MCHKIENSRYFRFYYFSFRHYFCSESIYKGVIAKRTYFLMFHHKRPWFAKFLDSWVVIPRLFWSKGAQRWHSILKISLLYYLPESRLKFAIFFHHQADDAFQQKMRMSFCWSRITLKNHDEGKNSIFLSHLCQETRFFHCSHILEWGWFIFLEKTDEPTTYTSIATTIKREKDCERFLSLSHFSCSLSSYPLKGWKVLLLADIQSILIRQLCR